MIKLNESFPGADPDLTALAAAGNSAVLAATTASFTTTDETKLDAFAGTGFVKLVNSVPQTPSATIAHTDLTGTSTGGNGAADAGKIVTFNQYGGVFAVVDDQIAILGSTLSGAGLRGESTDGIGAVGHCENGVGVIAGSSVGIGLDAYTDAGTHHARFGQTGIDQSFIARLKGAVGWIRGSFTGRIHPPDMLTADRTYTLPDASGTVALIETLGTAATTAATDYASASSLPIVGQEEAIHHFMDQLIALQSAEYPGDGKYLVVGGGGDSMGTSSGFNPYVTQELVRRFGQGAVASAYFGGANSGGVGQYTTSVVLGAGATENPEVFTYLPSGDFYSLTTAGTATVTETPNSSNISAGYTRVRCWFGRRSGGGTLTFTLSQNGVALTAKTANTGSGTAINVGSGAAGSIDYVDFVAADGLVINGRPTLVVSNAVGTSHYLGCYMYLGSGFIPVAVGRGGSSYAQALSSPDANLATFATAMDMRLCFHAVKEEDKTWVNMGLMMDRWAAQHPRCSHVWVGATESPVTSAAEDPASNAAMKAKALDLKMCFVDGQRLLRSHAYLNTIGPEARGWNEPGDGTGPHLSLPARRFIAAWIIQKVLLGLQIPGGRFSPQTLSRSNLGLLDNTQVPITIWAQTSTAVASSPFTQANATDHGRYTLNSAAGTPPINSGRGGQISRIMPSLYGRTMIRYRLFDGQLQDGLTVALMAGGAGSQTEAVLGMTTTNYGGFRIIHGVETISGQVVPFIRFAVKTTGTAETLSPKIYHSSTTGAAPYNGGTWSGNSEHTYWVELISNGSSLTKRFRAWHQPCEPTTGATKATPRRMIADWSGDVLTFSGVIFDERLWFAYISGNPAPVIGGNRSASIHGLVWDSSPTWDAGTSSIFQP